MSVLFRAERRDDAARLITDMGFRRSATRSGVRVNADDALRHSTVWACRAAIAEAIQQLPLEEQTRRSGQMVRRDPPALFYAPAPGWTWEAWAWAMAWDLAGEGKCYAFIPGLDSRGMPSALVPVDSSDVRWEWVQREKRWSVIYAGSEVQLWPRGPLWHCPLYVTAAHPYGLSPVAYHAETIGVGLAAQQFGARFFGDGGHPTMIATMEVDPGAEGAKALKARLMDAMRGNREPVFVPKGLDLKKWQVNPDESQFLNTMRYSGEDVCRIFGVPPGKVALAVSGSSVTYSNVSDANAEWRTAGLARYVNSFEAALSTLLPSGANRVLRLNFEGFLRADEGKRFSAYVQAAQIGAQAGTPLLTVNEMRAREGMAPLEGGDEFRPPKQPEPVQTRAEAPPVPNITVQPEINVRAYPNGTVEHRELTAQDVQAAMTAALSAAPPPSVTVNVPEQPAPVVNVAAPVVNVEPPAVVVDVQAPVVNMPAVPVQLTLTLPEEPRHDKTVRRNPDGSYTVSES